MTDIKPIIANELKLKGNFKILNHKGDIGIAKPIVNKKNDDVDRTGSKTAPIESAFVGIFVIILGCWIYGFRRGW